MKKNFKFKTFKVMKSMSETKFSQLVLNITFDENLILLL